MKFNYDSNSYGKKYCCDGLNVKFQGIFAFLGSQVCFAARLHAHAKKTSRVNRKHATLEHRDWNIKSGRDRASAPMENAFTGDCRASQRHVRIDVSS